MKRLGLLLALMLGWATAQAGPRTDGAFRLEINLTGSLQNPAFSPDGNQIVFTRFRRGYNRGPADLFIFNLQTGQLRQLVNDGSANINLPGASWNRATNQIVFSSDRGEHDEIFIIDANGQPGQERQITNRDNLQSFEPSFSADGRFIVFESHEIDDDRGVITSFQIGTNRYQNLTSSGAVIKQPNWSTRGPILYQELQKGRWAIWTMQKNGGGTRMITPPGWSSTDAAYSPSGRSILFSAENADIAHANLFLVRSLGGTPVQVTHYSGYDGAASIAPDNRTIAFESSRGDPDGRRTAIWVIQLAQNPLE